MIEALQDAILNKDPDAVVAAMADWDEDRRKAAIEPFNILMLALGFDNNVIQPCILGLDDPQVKEKRERERIEQMFWRGKNLADKKPYDYEMSYIAWLGRYGLESLEGCIHFPTVSNHQARAAQVMADRQPPWWDEWYAALVNKERNDDGISPEYWSLLYAFQKFTADDFPAVADQFMVDLPEAMKAAPEAIQRVLQEIPACRELVYSIPDDVELIPWTPVIEYLNQEKLLDSRRLLESRIEVLHRMSNQTQRNGCLMLMKAAKADAKTLAEFQAEWGGFLSDSQAVVAGFAVEQLKKIEQAGLLDAREVVTALPGIFSHKPKKHAKTALDLLARIAADEALRGEAVEAAAIALMHANKDIQSAALHLLEEYLRADDDSAQQTIALHLETIAPTLKAKAAALVQSQPAAEMEPGTEAPTTDLGELEARAAALPTDVRSLLRVDAAVTEAQAGGADLSCRWTQKSVPVLTTAAPLAPIETVEELIEVTSTAVEQLDDPDTAERIINGIMRLWNERPKSFQSMTESLVRRTCGSIYDRPQRGLVGGYFGPAFSRLIGAWLEVKLEFELDEEGNEFDVLASIQTVLHRYLRELEQRVRAKTAYPLISAATHAGGWLDPLVWVERLKRAQEAQIDVMEMDLERSCLRLAPEHRTEALEAAQKLKAPYQTLAMVAMGGEGNIIIDPAVPLPVWIAALRARDPWGDVSKLLPCEERSLITEDLAQLPDVIYPCDYKWTAGERLAGTTIQQDVIRAWAMQEGEQVENLSGQQFLSQMLEAIKQDEDLAEVAKQFANAQDKLQLNCHFLPAELHDLKVNYAPAFLYPFLAGQWPMKLDWYWCLATKALAKRVESGSSVEEPFDQFLVPLFQQDRPLTLMAARALWIATVSKDGNARSMSIEVWIALAESDRVDLDLLTHALSEVMAGGWVKLNRAGEVLAEVAAVGPVQAWCVAAVLETVLISLEPFPRNVGSLLEPLDEVSELLGRAVSPELQARLESIKSGKAKPLAKSLLGRVDTMTLTRQTAVSAVLAARLARAKRLADSEF